MDLNRALKNIATEVAEKHSVAVVRSLPQSEIEKKIAERCAPGDLHYPDILSAIGKLVTVDAIASDTLIKNESFFHQFISPDSPSMKNITVADLITRREEKYPGQTGTHIKTKAPGDCFSEEVYNNLPQQLKEICDLITDPRKKDVTLIGMITALSAAFSRYRFYHGSGTDVKEYSPHILALVVGAAGSGKGLTRYGTDLVGLVKKTAIEMRVEVYKKFKIDHREFAKELRRREKAKESSADMEEPPKPRKYAFAISASDTTQAALVEILNDNPAGCFGYDSEIDTLVQGNQRKDFGGFSDVIRKVFHHEPLARQRKGDGESYIVEKPRLAVMLSGTPDQLKKLIPSEYNGLFSRIWYYSIPVVFTPYIIGKNGRDEVGFRCLTLQEEVFSKADLWSADDVQITFTDEQENELYEAMQDKQSMEEIYGGDIGASWLRMAIIVKRIAVTLAGFEGTRAEYMPDNCWRAAIALLPALKSHCINALNIVRQNQGKVDISKEDYDVLKAEGKTDEKIAEQLGVNRRTIQRAKKKWDMGH